MKNRHLHSLTMGAMIAALYVCLTYLSSVFGLASGAVQVRISEALCVLPYFTAAAVPGLTVGCFVANLLFATPLDAVFGTLATLIGAVCTRLLRKQSPYLVPIPPIVANAVIIPFLIAYSANLPFEPMLLLGMAGTVGLGEVISCAVLGIPLLFLLKRYRVRLFGREG